MNRSDHDSVNSAQLAQPLGHAERRVPSFCTDAQLQDLARQIGPVPAMAFDIDGTLADAQGTVNERSVAALRSLAQAGIEPVIVTGRPLIGATPPLESAGHQGIVISSNGARIKDLATDEIIYDSPMPADESREAIAVGRALGLITVLTLAEHFVVELEEIDDSWRQGGYAVFNLLQQDLTTVEPHRIYNIMFGHPDPTVLDAHAHTLRQHFPHLDRSMANFFEMPGSSEGKDVGMRILAERKGISLDDVVGFGDGGNDVEWLRVIGHPIAMENARPEVVAVSQAQIGLHHEDAVARFVENYLQVWSPS